MRFPKVIKKTKAEVITLGAIHYDYGLDEGDGPGEKTIVALIDQDLGRSLELIIRIQAHPLISHRIASLELSVQVEGAIGSECQPTQTRAPGVARFPLA